LTWYERAVKASDSAASLSAVEMHAEQLSLPGSSEEDLGKAIERFELIQAIHGTSLRRSVMAGNAHRRLSMLLWASDHQEQRNRAVCQLELACRQYEAAAGCGTDSLYRYYPLRAALSCKLRAILIATLDAGPREAVAGDAATAAPDEDAFERELANTLREIQQAVTADPQFWTIVAQTEHEIIKGIKRGNLAARDKDIRGSLRDLHNRINTQRFWTYVHDDANGLLVPYIELMAGNPGELETAKALQQQLERYGKGQRDP
ncbi:MAG TPA: hypothetical protein VF774_24575, partial [Pseudoduganella sp.]